MSLILPKTCAMGGSNTGLVGTIGVTLLNPDGTTHTARATAGIYEIGGGCYGKEITFDDNWKGSIKWDTGGASPAYATEEYFDDLATIADAVWDEVLTGAIHNTPTSAGRRLRQLAAFAIHSETAQDGSNDTITLDSGASATDGIYNRNLCVIVEGTGTGQTRTIVEYNGTTKVAVVNRNWKTNPDVTSVFQILAKDVIGHPNHGFAQDGDSNSITLEAGASNSDDIYKGMLLYISTGTGADQARLITAYDGTSKIATISPAWITQPDVTSLYHIDFGVHAITESLATQAKADVNAEVDTALSELESRHGASSWETATGFATSDDVKRILGMVHENVYIDQPSYDTNKNLTSARLRIYSVAGSVGTDNDVLATYTITAVGDGAGKFTSWKMVKQ